MFYKAARDRAMAFLKRLRVDDAMKSFYRAARDRAMDSFIRLRVGFRGGIGIFFC